METCPFSYFYSFIGILISQSAQNTQLHDTTVFLGEMLQTESTINSEKMV